MIYADRLAIKGNRGPAWIQRDDETGLIDHVFYTGDRAEIIISFDQESLEKFAAMLGEFQKTGKAVHNPEKTDTGTVEADLSLGLEDEEIRFKIELAGSVGENEIGPSLVIAGEGFKVCLELNIDQVREIRERLAEIVSVLEGLEKVQQEKTIPAQSA